MTVDKSSAKRQNRAIIDKVHSRRNYATTMSVVGGKFVFFNYYPVKSGSKPSEGCSSLISSPLFGGGPFFRSIVGKNDAVSSADPKVLMKNRQRSFFISAKSRSAINLQYRFFTVFYFLLWKNAGFECLRNRLRKFNLFRANPFRQTERSYIWT